MERAVSQLPETFPNPLTLTRILAKRNEGFGRGADWQGAPARALGSAW
jgi:hypothetical protein